MRDTVRIVTADILADLARLDALWILDSIARRWRVTFDEVLGGARDKRASAARHELFASLWGSGWTYSEIGRVLRRDHTTIMAGVRKDLAS